MLRFEIIVAFIITLPIAWIGAKLGLFLNKTVCKK